ncbi:hypothetical protein SMD22_00350 (plasmid) [Brevibacillus halotolerans]|nr:hypothetical protein SMD22_00350 [Brevibacillus halotolerans]
MNHNEKLRKLNQISKATVNYSDTTDSFYVSVGLNAKEDGVLIGICEHSKTVEEAIDATFDRCISCTLVKDTSEGRLFYLWDSRDLIFTQIQASSIEGE